MGQIRSEYKGENTDILLGLKTINCSEVVFPTPDSTERKKVLEIACLN